MAMLLDAGALIAYDRGDQHTVAAIELARRHHTPVRTTTSVVAQVWRNGTRQARLARLLIGIDERFLSIEASRAVGVLLAAAATADVIDASLIEIANEGDEVMTSDPEDLAHLAEAAGKRLIIRPV